MIIGGLLAAFAIWLIVIGWALATNEGGHWFVSRLVTAAGATILVPIAFIGGFIVELANAAEPSMGRGFVYGLVGAGLAVWFAGHHWRRLRLDEEPGKPYIKPVAWDDAVIGDQPKHYSAPKNEPRAYVKGGRPTCRMCGGGWSAKPGGMNLVKHPHFHEFWAHPECRIALAEAYRAWGAAGRPRCDLCLEGWVDGAGHVLKPIQHPRTGEEVWIHRQDCEDIVVDQGIWSQSDLNDLPDPEESRIEELEERVRELEERLDDKEED